MIRANASGIRRLLVVVVMAVFGSVLVPAASAHDSTTETYEVEVPVYDWVEEPVMATREVPVFEDVPTEVEVERTREVDVYGFVPTEVQVQRTRQVPVYNFVPQQVEVQRTRQVPVYNFVPQQVEVQRTRQVPVYGFVPTAVPVQRTRVVPVYNEVTETVRVAPFRQRVTIQPPCEWVTVYGHRVYYCPPPRTTWQAAYNYTTQTRYVLVGIRTETYTATETQMVWTQTGTRTETYTATETQMVWSQTGTRTETYTATETQMVRTQTGTRTETYTATETQMVWAKTGTRTETYTATETQMVRTQTGTRTETYDTGATRLVKVDTGRTRTETRTRTVHTGCPDGYYELDSADTPAWHTRGGGVTFDSGFFAQLSAGEVVTWLGPLDGHPNCYTPDRSGIGWGKIVVAGAEYAVTGGEVVIDGVTYAVNAGMIVVDSLNNLGTVLKTAVANEIRIAFEELDESTVAAICTNMLVNGAITTAAGIVLSGLVAKALVAAGIALSVAVAPAAIIAGGVVYGIILAGCRLAESWYTPDVPPTPTGLSLVSGDMSLVVSWDASPSKDTFQFEYLLHWKRSSQSWDDATTKKLGDSTTTYTITGLTNDTAYNVRIEAQNLGGSSREVEATATPRAVST